MDAPSRLLDAALEIQAFCDAQGWRYCLLELKRNAATLERLEALRQGAMRR